MKVVIALWLVFGCATISRADINLAVICVAGATDGSARSSCTQTKYDQPTSDSLVRVGDIWQRFAGATGPVEVATNDVAPGSMSDPSTGAPATGWKFIPVADVPRGATNTTGVLSLTWTPPTTNTDGSPAKLTGYWIYSGAKGGSLSKLKQVGLVTAADLTYPSGAYDFAITALSADGESALSNRVMAVVDVKPVAVPNPPVLKAIDLKAYDLVKATNKATLALVGTLPAGTSCTASDAAPAGMAIVDRAKVVLSVKTRPSVVFARCL